jgi:hypothetical protein
MDYVQGNMTNGYVMIPQPYWDAVTWLGVHVKEGKSIVPSNVSPFVAAFTPLSVFVGHPTFTYHAQDKQQLLNTFYYGSRSDRQAVLSAWKPDVVWTPTWIPAGDVVDSGYGEAYKTSDVILYTRL